MGLWRRSDWLIVIGGAALLTTAAKWALHDTLALRVVTGPDTSVSAVANWQFAAGVAAGAALLALVALLRRRAPARYLAMALFALTLVKVFTVDMAKVETVYRILSFLCLGTLLVAGSWLYHRFFREKPAAE